MEASVYGVLIRQTANIASAYQQKTSFIQYTTLNSSFWEHYGYTLTILRAILTCSCWSISCHHSIACKYTRVHCSSLLECTTCLLHDNCMATRELIVAGASPFFCIARVSCAETGKKAAVHMQRSTVLFCRGCSTTNTIQLASLTLQQPNFVN